MFVKYDFAITDNETRLNFKVDIPTDKYLLNYIRLKLISKKENDRN